MPTIVKFNKHKLIVEVEKNVNIALKLIGKGLVKYTRDSMSTSAGSTPGSPPGVESGRLYDSITWATSFGPKSRPAGRAFPSDGVGKPKLLEGIKAVVVGSNVPYALALERGARTTRGKKRRVAARPYLWPALRSNKELIIESFKRV